MTAAGLLANAPAAPGVRTWTRDEFHRLADLGFFQNQRAERIGGQIVVSSPQNWRHTLATDKAGDAVRAALGAGFWTRTQVPLELGQASDPEPDVSAVAGRREDYSDHPRTAVLVVEVADSSLSYDFGEKANLYAAAGITDYWVVDLVNRRVVVHRDPRPDPALPFGAGYATVTAHPEPASVAPLAASGTPVRVAELLP